MKKIVATLLFVCTLVGGTLLAQTVPQGINYQAVARDASGAPIANQEITVRVSLGTEDVASEQFFAETHRIVTDAAGFFRVVIGRGAAEQGAFGEVPWAEQQIWLNLEIFDNRVGGFRVLSTNELLSVPYAFYAEKADRLVDDEEIALRTGSSIYWTTTGNEFTRAPFHFLGTRDDQPLYFKTNNETRVVLTAQGQMKIFSGVGKTNSSDSDYDDYPLTIQGSEQGIYIKVNDDRSSANNFVTFADDGPGDGDGIIHGRIEGQTLDELYASVPYQIETALFALSIVSLSAQLVALAAEAIGLAASTFGAGAVVGVVASAVGFAVNLAGLIVQRDGYIRNVVNNVGVAYNSGGADYAEWLMRAPKERDLMFGEVVGVRAGQVSLRTDSVDHIMVVSQAPIVLGNAPQPDEEASYEKIAFMGQVAVRVVGPVALGDYILPSGNNDGLGIAVHPDDMQAGDYHRIIGVAWEAAEDAPLNIVNVAVGINANDLSEKVAVLNTRVDNILGYLQGEEPLMDEEGAQLALKNQMAQPQTTYVKMMTDEEFDQLLDNNRGLFKYIFAQAEKQLEAQGGDFAESEAVQALFADPIQSLKELRRNADYTTQWGLIDQKFKTRGQ